MSYYNRPKGILDIPQNGCLLYTEISPNRFISLTLFSGLLGAAKDRIFNPDGTYKDSSKNYYCVVHYWGLTGGSNFEIFDDVTSDKIIELINEETGMIVMNLQKFTENWKVDYTGARCRLYLYEDIK